MPYCQWNKQFQIQKNEDIIALRTTIKPFVLPPSVRHRRYLAGSQHRCLNVCSDLRFLVGHAPYKSQGAWSIVLLSRIRITDPICPISLHRSSLNHFKFDRMNNSIFRNGKWAVYSLCWIAHWLSASYANISREYSILHSRMFWKWRAAIAGI